VSRFSHLLARARADGLFNGFSPSSHIIFFPYF
jgi:hypothetical protein